MAELLVTKKADGNYVLSPKGVLQAYFITMRKLLAHYLQNGLKKNPQETQILLQNFSRFAQEKLTEPDAYLDNLVQIAQLIGEVNPTRLSQFIGQHFLTQLEKTQEQLLAQEVAKVKEILDIPYRTPSVDLLLKWGDDFRKAKPLVWPVVETNQNLESDGTPAAELPIPKVEKEKLPGERLLLLFGEEFSKAEVLNWKPNALPTEESSATPILAIPEEKTLSILPGERLLKEFGEAFQSAPALKFSQPTGEEETEIDNSTMPKLPVQMSFREYLQLVQNVKKFTQNKDSQGYQAWYNKLDIRGKLILHLNNLVQRSLRGESLYWPQEFLNLAQKTGIESAIIEKIKQEIEAYLFVSNKIQEILRQAIQRNLPQPMAQNLYGQLISLFENKDNYGIKKTGIKMALLSITQPEAKAFLENELSNLLEKVVELYPLER